MQDWNEFSHEIVDAHHHLWDLQKVQYPWLMAQGVTRFFGDPAPIQKNYLVADFKQDFAGVPIKKSVHIQVGAAPGWETKEARWLQHCHATEKLPSAFVAYCDLHQASRSGVLDELQKFSALRGIRQIVGRHPDEDKVTGTHSLLNSSKWLSGLQELADRELCFDLQLIPDQMLQIHALLTQVPNLKVALCHCGSPWYTDSKGFALWQTGLERLASLPNVYCKISGLGMFDHNWSVSSLKPTFDIVIETFGAQRCMLGSNFPVDKLYASYAHLWQSYAELSLGLSETEKRDLFGKTCTRFYQL